MSRTLLLAALAALAATSVLAQTVKPATPGALTPKPATAAPKIPKPPGTAPTAANGQPSLGGPLIKGLCLLSEEVVLRDAKVSIAANQRLQQLKDQAQGEVNAARAPIDVDYKTLQADAAKTEGGKPAPADIETRRQAIQARYQAVQNLADQRNREIDATRTKASARLSAELQPVVAAAYRARGCGLLLNRNAVLGGNLGGDLTDEVVKGLDARITSLTFEREILPPAAAK